MRRTLFLALALSSTAASAQVAVPLPQPGKRDAAPPAAPQPAAPAVPARRYNPYDRDIELTVPLEQRGKQLGEVAVLVTRDDHVKVAAAPFAKLAGPLLNEAGKAKLTQALGSRAQFEPEELAAAGITLQYDPQGLTLEIVAIAADERALESLFRRPTEDETPPDILPAHFSAFLNASVVENRLWSGVNKGFQKPAFYLNGAMRVGPIVFEGDGQFAQRDLFLPGSSYRFDRNYARFVFDQPEDFRRFYLGDLTPEIRGDQGYVQMGGVGVSRQRRRFDQFISAILQGNRRLLLQRDSTVDVYRNGSLYQQFHLAPGSYDLSALPLLSGSNDVRVEVRDASGAVQSLDYQSYLDPIDLEPGDYEYSAYVGRVSNRFGLSPVYNGPLAFTGFFRKAFVGRPAIGIGVQASAKVQQLTGQTQFILLGGSRLQLQGGVSHAPVGTGYSAGLAFDKLINHNDLVDSLTLQVTYESRRFAGLGYDRPDNSSAWSLTALYSRSITRDIIALIGATYLKNRGALGDNYRVYANSAYRFSRKWRIQGGLSYAHFGSTLFTRGGLGFNVSLVFQPNYSDRVEIRHDSSIDSSEASYVHAGSNRIGSVGYGAIAGRELGTVNGQAFVDYTGNRFDASLSHAAFGSDLSHITDRQVTAARVSTSLVFADGQFGVGRRVGDSFALLYPHSTLKGHAVVAGQSLAQNDYLSKSGLLGGAVNGYLASYVTQSIQYDVENPPPGYDIGPGVVRVRPSYHSGYKLRVGTDAFVSAIGTIELPGGAPVVLGTGAIVSLDRKEEAKPFFTNSIGRFAIENLRPGERYRVDMNGGAGQFEFVVPKGNSALLDLKIVRLGPQHQE